MTDTARIKRNISKMIEQGAPEAEIDSYVAAEGTTPEALRGEQTDTSLSGAVRQGASDIASGVGSTLKHFTGAADAADVAKGVGAELKKDGYQSASAEFAKTLDPTLIPRGLVEQLPGLATDVLSATALGKLTKFAKLGAGLGRVAGGVGSFGARTLGPEAEARAAYRTGDANATPTDEDKTYAVGSTGVQALINQAGLSRFLSPRAVTGVGAKGVAQSAARVGEKALAEGITETAQDVVSQTGQTINTPKGLDINPQQALAGGVLGAAGGGTFATARGAKDAMAAVRMRDLGGFEAQATRVGNRLTDKVGGDSADLGAKSSYTAIRDVQSDLNNEITQAARGQTLSTEASNAIKRAKAGKELNDTDVAAVDTTPPDLADLVKQAHALTVLKRIGVFDSKSQRFAGGPSERVRKFVMHHPTFSMKYFLPGAGAGAGLGAMSGDALMGALPGIGTAAAIGAAGYGGAKFAENLLGLSNPARTFAEKFADGTTPVRLPPPQTIRSPMGSVPRVAQTQPAQPWGPAPTKEDVKAKARQARTLQKILKEAEKAQARAADKQAKAESGLDQDIRNMVMGEARIRKMREAAEAASATQAPPQQPQAEGPTWSIPPRMQQGPVENLPDVVQQVRAEQKAKPKREYMDEDGVVTEEKPSSGNAYELPEVDYVDLGPRAAAELVTKRAIEDGKQIDDPEGYEASTERRLRSEREMFIEVAKRLDTAKDKAMWKPYLSALWAAHNPRVVHEIIDNAKAVMPHRAELISQFFTPEQIRQFWEKKKKQ